MRVSKTTVEFIELNVEAEMMDGMPYDEIIAMGLDLQKANGGKMIQIVTGNHIDICLQEVKR